MKISVIIPLFNVSSYIEACLKSVIGQTWTEGDLECIIVDDCGIDDSVDKVKSFLSSYNGDINFALIHHDQNKGLSEARNTGIKNATGDYVYFLDSDDEITPDSIEKLAAPLRAFGYDFVFANHKVVCSWSNMNLNLTIQDGPYRSKNDVINSYHHGWFATAWNKLVRRDLLINNNLFFEPGILHEDELWSFKLACLANNMYVVNDRTYVYYMRSGSIMSDLKTRRHFESYTKVLEERIQSVKRYHLEGNLNLYNIIEDSKLDCMKYAKRLLPYNGCKAFYYRIRSYRYLCSCNSKVQKYKAKLRDFQYKLPKQIAFFWILLLNFSTDVIVAYRHR